MHAALIGQHKALLLYKSYCEEMLSWNFETDTNSASNRESIALQKPTSQTFLKSAM